MDLIRDTLEKIEKIALPIIEAEGLELYEVEYKRESTGWVIRIYIARPGRGTSLDDCVRISRQLSALFDVEDLVKHPYNLEVSSPGLTRKLSKPRHFQLSIGERAKIKIRDMIDNRKTFTGVIKAVNGSSVVITEDDGTDRVFDVDGMLSAKLYLEI